MTDDRHERIRTRAYDLWLQDGRPEGLEEVHWRKAEQQIAGEEAEAAASPAEAPPPPEGTPPLSPSGGVAGPRQAKRSRRA